MKIIKRGRLPGEREYDAQCSHCGTTFQFTQAEAEIVDDEREGDYVKINCPVCNKTVTVTK